MEPPSFDLAAYLARIGLAEAPPDAEGLRAIQQAHLRAIPFENFDPLLGRVSAVGLADVVSKIVHGGRGGYCFEQNTLFEAALRAVGFATRRRLARVRMRFGPEASRSHLVLLAETEGRSFLADAGFGGPGSLVPFELRTGIEQQAPNGTYRLVEDAARGEMVLERRDGDGWVQLYAFDDARVSDGEIASANYFCATWGDVPFGSHLVLGCYRGDTRYGLFDRLLTIETPQGAERRELADLDDFTAFVRGEAGLRLDDGELARSWERIAAPA